MDQINHYFIRVLRQEYGQFNGTVRREAYWMFMLITFIGSLCVALIAGFLGLYLLNALYALALFIPILGMSVRRLRDVGLSVWWILLGLIPVIGEIMVLLLCALPSGYAGKHLKIKRIKK